MHTPLFLFLLSCVTCLSFLGGAEPDKNGFYSNFFAAVNPYGYCGESEQYGLIVSRLIEGVFEVPVVHCAYLVQTHYIPQLTYVDGSDDYEFVIFSRSAREHSIAQFISNEKEFGYLLDPSKKISLEEEALLVEGLPELQSLLY